MKIMSERERNDRNENLVFIKKALTGVSTDLEHQRQMAILLRDGCGDPDSLAEGMIGDCDFMKTIVDHVVDILENQIL